MSQDKEDDVYEDEETDIYDEETMDELEEDDEITPVEEAFMKGYVKGKKKSKISKHKHSSQKRARH